MKVFDLETDGFLEKVTKIHCLLGMDSVTGEEFRYTDHEFFQDVHGNYTDVPTNRTGTIRQGIRFLKKQKTIAGHNIIGYDVPVMEKLSGMKFRETHKNPFYFDTLVAVKAMYPNLYDLDLVALRKRKVPAAFKAYLGRHSLRAWAIRLKGPLKADFDPKDYGHTWETVPYIKEMDDYCMDDVRANTHLLKFLLEKNWDPKALKMEMAVREIVNRQVEHGWQFDIEGGNKLMGELLEAQAVIIEKLQKTFPPWQKSTGMFTPKRNDKKRGYVKGVTIERFKEEIFNPGSGDQIAARLKDLYGWKPEKFTPAGKPAVDEEVISKMPWPEARQIADYLIITARIGQLFKGKKAWLSLVDDTGRIHGKVDTNGAATTRMTHSNPNVAQTPANDKPYGKQCRALFTVPPGKVLVGCDASSLELAMLAHYMAEWDNGSYSTAVSAGDKASGTDPHTINQHAVGLNTRDSAKTWVYAFIYGAGNEKLGAIVLSDFDDEQRSVFLNKYTTNAKRTAEMKRIGKKSRENIAKKLPALDKFIEKVKKSATLQGNLKVLDGRYLPTRAVYSAPNLMLQSAGSIVMKKSLVVLDKNLGKMGLQYGLDYEFVGNIHDEFQIEVTEEYGDTVGKAACDAITQAGVELGVRCPLAGEYSVGQNWSETH